MVVFVIDVFVFLLKCEEINMNNTLTKYIKIVNNTNAKNKKQVLIKE